MCLCQASISVSILRPVLKSLWVVKPVDVDSSFLPSPVPLAS